MTFADSTSNASAPAKAIAATPMSLPDMAKPLDQYSFFQALRQIERQRDQQPRIGYARRPADESVRIGQPAELTFAPSTLTNHAADVITTDHAQPGRAVTDPVRIEQRFLGLLGPNGPMPLHFTETVRDRLRHAGDDSLQAFLDIFHHRLATLFYRAWSDAQPAVQHDRPADDNFARFLGALVSVDAASPTAKTKNSTSDDRLDDVKRYHAGQFVGSHRHPEGLACVLTRSLQVPTRVSSFALRTLMVSTEDRTALNSQRGIRHSRRNNCLGQTAQLGVTVPDRSSMIDIQVGPIDYARFQRFLPGGTDRVCLTSIVRHYAGPAIDARVTVQLHRQQVPTPVLGKSGQLGRTCWMGSQPISADRSDYTFEITKLPAAHEEPKREAA